jgi:hypothetical protein
MQKRVRCYEFSSRTFPFIEMDPDTPEKAKARKVQTLLYILMAAFVLSPLVIYCFIR